LHIITNELEKIAAVFSREATERQRHYETHIPVVEEVAEEVEVCEAREEEEEPPKKKMRLTAGIC
jgi:hypothetical protein